MASFDYYSHLYEIVRHQLSYPIAKTNKTGLQPVSRPVEQVHFNPNTIGHYDFSPIVLIPNIDGRNTDGRRIHAVPTIDLFGFYNKGNNDGFSMF